MKTRYWLVLWIVCGVLTGCSHSTIKRTEANKVPIQEVNAAEVIDSLAVSVPKLLAQRDQLVRLRLIDSLTENMLKQPSGLYYTRESIIAWLAAIRSDMNEPQTTKAPTLPK